MTMRLPTLRPNLIARPLGTSGRFVLKDPRAGSFFEFGPQEFFLLQQLDGVQEADKVCSRFTARFGEALAPEELHGFVELANQRGLVTFPTKPTDDQEAPLNEPVAELGDLASPPTRKQSLLCMRWKLFDPDRLLTRWAPRLWFLWTPLFLAASAVGILMAVITLWTNRAAFASHFAHALQWETLLLAWLTLVGVTLCHEFAHGLTCKHYGGEVHEIGFLLLFLLPGLYCNVSDAWLLPEKSKRAWVTIAGGYCELCLWALAVFVWRATLTDSLVNYLAWVVVSICSVRVLFNFNPLLKLDGYYLLSDLAEVPNLRQRALAQFWQWARWLLWGAPRPAAAARSKFLFGFGAACLAFSSIFLGILLVGLVHYWKTDWGLAAAAGGIVLGLAVFRPLLAGSIQGEVRQMLRTRRFRTGLWLLFIAGTAAALALVPWNDRVGGDMQIRPTMRYELRAPVAGFVSQVNLNEGDRVSENSLVAILKVPDLETRSKHKEAELRESEAKLRLFELGARPDSGEELREPLEGAKHWRDMARVDAERAHREGLKKELEYLSEIQQQLELRSSTAAGVVVTPHLKEREGRYLQEGDLLCEIEDRSTFLVEIELAEQYAARVQPGQKVALKLRALPFETFETEVERIAPAADMGAEPDQEQSYVTVYCRLPNEHPDLRSGMQGYARIYRGERPVGAILYERVLGFLRTEFWW